MKTKRWIAALLCFLLIGSLFPTRAFAADIASGTGWNLDADGVLHITGDIPESGFNLTDEQKQQVKSAVAASGASISSGKFLFNGLENMTSADLSLLNTTGVTSMGYMFSVCSSLTSLDLSSFDTSSVTNMGYMFYGCSSLTFLNLSSFDTSSVTTMDGMFSGCRSLTSLDVSGFSTSNVTSMIGMFTNCSSLTSLNLSSFDTGSMTSMACMFLGCSSLTSIDLSKFETGNVTSMGGMFYNCSGLTSLDLSSFDTRSVNNMGGMFCNCSGLTSLDLSSFDTSSVDNMSSMFDGCSSLTSLDVSGFRTDRLMYAEEMFRGCSALTALGITPDILDENADDIIAIRSSWQKQGSTDTYSTADELKAVTDTVTLLAMYTVTFDANGGSVTPTSAVTGTDGKLVSLPTPTRSGSYRFNGWYTAASGGTKVTVDNVYPADTTIYAYWTYTGGGVTYYTLTFNVNGGSAIGSVSGTYGKVIGLDKYVPTKDGFDFGGWYSDSALTTPVDEIKLNGSKTVYAKWTEKAPVVLPFTDVEASDWSHDDIYYVWEKGLMQGTGEATFAPKTDASRAMIVTILWNLEGKPVVNYAMSFDDAADGQWYTEAIRWAQANGIVGGYSAEKFGTNDPVTREQMALILYRYAQSKGEGFTGSWMFPLGFEDAANISSWADEAMHWCVMKELISGVGNNLLDPQGKATREQVAAILHRFCENIVK